MWAMRPRGESSVPRSGDIDAVWILGPNDSRLEHMRAIHQSVGRRRTPLQGVACEKPLARTEPTLNVLDETPSP